MYKKFFLIYIRNLSSFVFNTYYKYLFIFIFTIYYFYCPIYHSQFLIKSSIYISIPSLFVFYKDQFVFVLHHNDHFSASISI